MTEAHKLVLEIIAEKTGVDISEITTDSFFEDDLNVSEMELIEILSEIEEALDIEELLDKKDSIESVADLVEIVEDLAE